MVLSRDDIAGIVEEALKEIGMAFADQPQLEATAIARVLQQLQDAGGTTWDPSPDVIAGLIVLLFLQKKNYPNGFDGTWFKNNSKKKVADLIDDLNGDQIDLG